MPDLATAGTDFAAAPGGTLEGDPAALFARTHLTGGFRSLAGDVLCRLGGAPGDHPSLFCLTAGFGGGKSHALMLLRHLCSGGAALEAGDLADLLGRADLDSAVPAPVWVFSGQAFDALRGRGGGDEPLRRTPWGDLAFALGGRPALAAMQRHDRSGVAPSSDVLVDLVPPGPVLLLLDEVMNYASRAQAVPAGPGGASTLGTQFHAFLHNLTEAVRSRPRSAMVIGLPVSPIEVAAADLADFRRLQRLVGRAAVAVSPAERDEVPAIIRRRIFGCADLPPDAQRTVDAYARWAQASFGGWPGGSGITSAEAAFASTYPFHPAVADRVRLWLGEASFQGIRGALRVLALWARGAADSPGPLLTLGSAPLGDPAFREALLEQLGASGLEAAIAQDVAGPGALAGALDRARPSAPPWHGRAARAVLLCSLGSESEGLDAPGLQRVLGGPDGGSEVLVAAEELARRCHFLHREGGRYRFAARPNLRRVVVQRAEAIPAEDAARGVAEAVRRVWQTEGSAPLVVMANASRDIPDRPTLTLAVLGPGLGAEVAERWGHLHGSASRAFRNALVFCLAPEAEALGDQARMHLAWQEVARQRQDPAEREACDGEVVMARQELDASVRRAYRTLVLLGRDGRWRSLDLDPTELVMAQRPVAVVLERLRETEDLADAVSPAFLVRHWPPAAERWSTAAIREAFFRAPVLPRLLDADAAVRVAIERGIGEGVLWYQGPGEGVVIAPDAWVRRVGADPASSPLPAAFDLAWRGKVPVRRWGDLLRRVLRPLAATGEVELEVAVRAHRPRGLPEETGAEVRRALEDIGEGL